MGKAGERRSVGAGGNDDGVAITNRSFRALLRADLVSDVIRRVVDYGSLTASVGARPALGVAVDLGDACLVDRRSVAEYLLCLTGFHAGEGLSGHRAGLPL